MDMTDTRDVYESLLAELEKTVPGLGKETKDIVAKAMEFGYNAAFSERTCVMNGMMYQSNRYSDGYKRMLEILK
jgi:hypothetical protein